ncbi:spore coat protein GerQ [Sediminibacillus massiliensis]|uniref:spore coat protein GerQ n=1 Tax=Sediminibacillus massiliensis TaxID=1926277 RepID=UPI000988434E|nr:spore coat protein GerQ [Sediminibacillus massiliensis]
MSNENKQGNEGIQQNSGYTVPGYGYAQYPPYYYQQAQPALYQGYRQMPGQMAQQAQQQQQTPAQQANVSDIPGMLPTERSYIENILRLNRGKEATFYMTFENNERWNAMVFHGIIEAAGRDHIIISDPETGRRYLLLMVYLDYVTFDEELNYTYPYNSGGGNQLVNYPPR